VSLSAGSFIIALPWQQTRIAGPEEEVLGPGAAVMLGQST